jgi:hypothetical protein
LNRQLEEVLDSFFLNTITYDNGQQWQQQRQRASKIKARATRRAMIQTHGIVEPVKKTYLFEFLN